MSDEKLNFQRQADRTRPNSKRSVLSYLLILFGAAVILMLLAYLMDQRTTNEETISGLQQSISSMQSAQEIYEENGELKEQILQHEAQIEELEDQIRLMQDKIERQASQSEGIQQQTDDLEKSIQALDWFWQINEAYVRERYNYCRELIALLNNSGLIEYLPRESITDNGRFSPYDRYQEIYDALN